MEQSSIDLNKIRNQIMIETYKPPVNISDDNEFISSNPLSDEEIFEFIQTFPELLVSDCINEFLRCVDKIKSFDLDMYSIRRNLQAFVSKQSGATIFEFKCRKYNYEVSIVYLTDNKLVVTSVRYLKLNFEIFDNREKVNLFDCIASDQILFNENFSKLMNSTTPEIYIQNNFGHFFRLSGLLIAKYRIYTCLGDEIRGVCMRRFRFSPDIYNFDAVGLVVTHNGNLTMIYMKIIEENSKLKYGLGFAPVSKNYPNEKIDLRLIDSHTEMAYDSGTSIKKVYLNIIANQEHSKGLYGFYDESLKKYFNESQLISYLTGNKFVYTYGSYKNHSGSGFAFNIKISPVTLPTSTYILNLNYDSVIDDKCNIQIHTASEEIQRFSGTYINCYLIYTKFIRLMMGDFD